jgi:hypothetical protein
MPEKRKDHWDIALALVIGLILTMVGIIGLSGMLARPSSVSAATETIEVSATVQSWVSLAVTPTSTTLTPDLVTTTGGTNIGESDYIQITTGTNGSSGYTLDIKSLNAGLCHSGGCGSGKLDSASTTLSAGTSGYGGQATSTDVDVTVNGNYLFATGTDAVGGFITTDVDLTDTSGPSSGDISWLTLKAAATSTAPSGTYQDVLTLTLTAL